MRGSPQPPVDRICRNCGGAFTISAGRVRAYAKIGRPAGFFCSRVCHGAHTRGGIKERFERYVHPEPNSGCYLWDGAYRGGYAILSADRKSVQASHIALRFAGRPLMAGERALHRCDNPCCVNADHLFSGSQQNNVDDAIAKGHHKTPNRQGIKNAQAKLSEEDVLFIAQRTKSAGELATMFGVCASTISSIWTGRLWSWLLTGNRIETDSITVRARETPPNKGMSYDQPNIPV